MFRGKRFMDNNEGLFIAEENTVREAEAVLASKEFRQTPWAVHFEKLLLSYKKLYGQTRRIMKMADMFQKDLSLATEKLEVLSNIDELTSIANRRSFEITYEREWKLARREATPLAVLMVDIDYFKQFNDVYGHLAGDRCLKKVAKTIAGCLKRPTDFLARYGGDEFVVILPRTDADGSSKTAEEIRARVNGLEIEHKSSVVFDNLTVSIGLTVKTPRLGETPNTLLEAADTALYQAKRDGRDKIAILHLE
jgi:diguanylate cyclase (GGDEF)-like protein